MGIEPGLRDALAQAQAEHDFLHVAVGVGKRLGFFDRQLVAAEGIDITRGVLDVKKALVAQMRVGAWACTPPIAVYPVDAVVLALAAGLRPVGDLVPLEAFRFEGGGNHLIAPCQHVLIGGGQDTFIDLARHAGAVFHDERISTDVVYAGL